MIGYKRFYACFDKSFDNLAAQQGGFAAIADIRMNQFAHFLAVWQGRLQQGVHFIPMQKIHFQAIFQINDGVAKVISGFHQVRQRVAAEMPGFVFQQAGGEGHFMEGVGFRYKGAVLARFAAGGAGIGGQPGVFEEGGQGRIGQAHAAVVLVIFALGNDAKALGVALKKCQVGLLVRGQHIQKPLPSFLKPGADGSLAGVAKGRVANVVGQTGGLNNVAKIGSADGVG